MSHYSLLNKLLEKQGASIINENKKTAPVTKNNKKSVDKKKLNESDILYQELDKLTENAIKETLKSTILESVLPDSIKLTQTEAISDVQLKEEEILGFMNDTIDPIIETVGTFNDSKVVKASNKKNLKAVSIPVYEVALTLEAARLGALTEESLEDTPVKDDVEPIIDEVGATAEANLNKTEKVDPDEKTLTDLVEPEDDGNYYTFGELKEMTEDDLMDVHQYEDFESMGGDENADVSEEKEFNDASDIEDVENEEAGGDEELFKAPMIESKATILAKLMRGLNENMEDTTDEVEVEQDEETVTYEGQPAGEPGPGENAAGELEGDGTSDEAIVEQQILIARQLLGNIFKEYGIKNKQAQRTVVREAMHYIFKYGAKNLIPSYTDVSQLVLEQNKLSDLHNIENAKLVVDFTKPILTPVQEVTIQNKSLEYLSALAAAKELTREASEKIDSGTLSNQKSVNTYRRQLEEAANIKEAVAYILRANGIERTRQAFRHRMHHFNENAKTFVANSWILKETNNTPVAKELKNQLTVRKFVTEAVYVKRDCINLKENNPIAKPELYKKSIKNASLPIAALVTEVACVWKYMKKNFYNNQPLTTKKLALEAMTNVIDGYLNIFDIPTAKKDIKVVFENFEYRLQSLKDKINIRLNEGGPLDAADNRPSKERLPVRLRKALKDLNAAAYEKRLDAQAAIADLPSNLRDKASDLNAAAYEKRLDAQAAVPSALANTVNRIKNIPGNLKGRYTDYEVDYGPLDGRNIKAVTNTDKIKKDAAIAGGIAAGGAALAMLISKILKNKRATTQEKLAALQSQLDACKTDKCKEQVQKAIAALA